MTTAAKKVSERNEVTLDLIEKKGYEPVVVNVDRMGEGLKLYIKPVSEEEFVRFVGERDLSDDATTQQKTEVVKQLIRRCVFTNPECTRLLVSPDREHYSLPIWLYRTLSTIITDDIQRHNAVIEKEGKE